MLKNWNLSGDALVYADRPLSLEVAAPGNERLDS